MTETDTDITIYNFKEKFDEIKTSLQQAKFVSIDLEFSALHPFKNQSPSLFDTPKERYEKLRKNVQLTIPLQIGITAFSFDPDTGIYVGNVYNCYLIPASFPFVQKNFLFQSDTLEFLNFFGFDFNKCLSSGVPYINKDHENELRCRFKNNEITEVQLMLNHELDNEMTNRSEDVKKWLSTAENGDTLILPKLLDKYEHNYQVLYYFHKNCRRRFKSIWTYVENNQLIIKKVSAGELEKLNRLHNIDEEIIDNLLGFTKVFRLLTSLQKPLVGHNLMQDILILIENFETTLPASYNKFKKLVNTLFPKIYDTKTISYELKHSVPEEKRWDDRSLSHMFEYFKNGTGRHLVLNSPAIEIKNCTNQGKYHEAGWDSFCTGYIFIRMAYFNIYHKFPKSKTFVSAELIAGLSDFQNRVNVIRGAVSNIKLDGVDPASTRPPYLVVESAKNRSLNIPEVSSILSSYGFVEIKKFPFQSRRALIAVDNFGSARRILNNFRGHNEYHIKHYNVLRHSLIVRACFLSGITFSGVFLYWVTKNIIKK